jgi:UDP-N-acetylmuramyl pentapeptide phosphotransferase/UDP-N-acetylglucosamine-1-phosphate transferase
LAAADLVPVIISLILVGLVVTLASWAATGAVLMALRRHGVFDRPNQRSSHSTLTPRGGGIAVIFCLLLASVATKAMGLAMPAGIWPLLAGVAVLAAVSWVDDLRNISARFRLLIQALCVTMPLLAFESAGPVFQGIFPPVLDKLLAGLAWLWFINLFNFMDGIDGMSATETICIGFGLAAAALITGEPYGLALPAVIAGAAGLGFVAWNWAPAKIFLGDVGSVPLGYFLGGLLLWAAANGFWELAAILPLYYLVDATGTLLRRASRGGRFWEPHREHAYQRAVQGGLSHAAVVRRVALCNLALIAAAVWAAAGHGIFAIFVACCAVLALMLEFRRHFPKS